MTDFQSGQLLGTIIGLIFGINIGISIMQHLINKKSEVKTDRSIWKNKNDLGKRKY